MKWMQWMANWFGGQTKSLGSVGIGLRAVLSGGSPGGWASDHREETAHNTGFNYIAIHAIAAQVAGATVTVFADGDQQPQRQSRRKSLAARVGSFARWKSTYGADDRETDPLPIAHPLVQLLKRPNPYESGASFRYRQAQQMRLTGTCLVWNVPSLSGPTCERYVIPTAMASPVAPTLELPRGGWRINPVASRYTPIVDDGYVDCPSWYRILGQIVDARQVQLIRLPHAWYLDDGQSPLSAGAKWVDAGEAVDAARFHQLKNGIDPSVVWNLPPDVSPDQDEIDRVQAKISAKYGGPENVGRVMVAQSGTAITPLSTSPKDMCYTEGFHDFKAAILALHQTPPVAVGLQEPGAYAAYNASMKAWRHAAVQPLCDMLAESDTEHLAPQFGSGLTVEIESDTVDDTELIEQQLQNDLAAKVRTKNEWRSVRGLPPLPGSLGDALVGTDSDQSPAPNHSSPATTDNTLATDTSSTQTKTHSQRPDMVDQAASNDTDQQPPTAPLPEQSDIPAPTTHRENQREADDEDRSERARFVAEILYGLFGPSLFSGDAFWPTEEKTFDPSKHPRDRLGRFTNADSPDEISSARDVISKILNGDRSVTADTALHHLSVLSTSALESLHKEHGVVPPPKIRSHLVRGVLARLTPFPNSDSRAFPPADRSNKVDVFVQQPERIAERLPLRPGTNEHLSLTSEEWGQLVGAQPGARVYVFPDGFSGIEVFVDHPDYRARRNLNHKRMIENSLMKVSPRKQRHGLASRILSQQVETATRLGFKSIKAWAVGDGTEIRFSHDRQPPGLSAPSGYYAWPRLGFTGKIDRLMRERRRDPSPEIRAIAADFDKNFPGVTEVSELMKTARGRDWWKRFGGPFEARFGLASDSPSRQILEEYLKEKAAESQQKRLAPAGLDRSPDHDQLTSVPAADLSDHLADSDKLPARTWFDWEVLDGENPDLLSPSDEAILDRIWDRIGDKMPSESSSNDTADDDDSEPEQVDP